jgi:hypothetical protein
MMKGNKTLAVVFAVATAFAHPGAEAASGMDGLEACASALARELSTNQGAGIQVRISEDSLVPDRRLSTRTTYHLDARDPRNNAVVARADCAVDARAKVKSLVRLPDDAPDAAERSL